MTLKLERVCSEDTSISFMSILNPANGTTPSRKLRVDHSGQAFAGSQRWLQYYVNHDRGSLLPSEISRQSGTIIGKVEWRSPLVSENFKEYRDGDFLKAVGQTSFWPSLRQFWPRMGPCWDALATVIAPGLNSGALLVEAKSYPGELKGSGCKAGPASRDHIGRACEVTKAWLGANASADWLGPLYQSANRLANLYFLRQIYLVCRSIFAVKTGQSRQRQTSKVSFRSRTSIQEFTT